MAGQTLAACQWPHCTGSPSPGPPGPALSGGPIKGIAPVADVVEPVSDTPVRRKVACQLPQVGPRSVSTGDHADPLSAVLLGAEFGTVALHPHHLPDPGETEILPDVGGGDLSPEAVDKDGMGGQVAEVPS